MYYLKKTIEIAGAHFLKLPYESKCSRVHGHNWVVTVFCKSEELNSDMMVVDFTDIKKIIMELDHTLLNDTIEQPTAELIAHYLCKNIPFCYRVEVQESQGNMAAYEEISD